MPVSMFDPRVLMGVIRNQPVKPQYLRDTFFRRTITHVTESIDVDIVKGKRRVAPFVAPVRQGVVVNRDGFTTQSFKPGYIKVKRTTSAGDLMVRSPGESIYDQFSPEERARAMLSQDLMDLTDMIDMAEEVMAAEALTTGAINLRDEKNVVNRVVDFGLAASHKVTLAGGNRWSQSTADPIGKLQAWVQLLQEDSGANPDIILMAPDVAAALMAYFLAKSDSARMQALAIDRGTLAPNAPALPGGATFLGKLNEVGIPMYSYAAKYTDLAGNAQPLIPSGKVVVASIAGMQAAKQYGLIRDLKALYATDRFAKSWEEEDPSQRWLMVQSAPIMNPYNVDAYMYANVL